jgi:archaellum biogenesis ATPase FlaH
LEVIEITILRNLLKNDDYARKVLPFLKPEYFEGQFLNFYEIINDFYASFNTCPTAETLEVKVGDLPLVDAEYEMCIQIFDALKEVVDIPNTDWLVDETESFCKDRAYTIAAYEAIDVIESDKNGVRNTIPEIFKDALSVSFDTNIGMSYFDDVEDRYKYYTEVEERIPFDIDIMNIITRNGVPKKTLNIVMGDTNVGKSLILCYLAGAYAKQGYNVLYISLEMSEEAVNERLDAHLLDIPIDQLGKQSFESFSSKVEKLRSSSYGQVVTKEFPNGSASTGHFRHLLNELQLKQNFKPDIICIDYLNICASSRYKSMSGVNSYSYVKAIAEEVRALAVERDVPIWTATQSNRDASGSTDMTLSNTSESYGVPQTADFMLGVTAIETAPDRYFWTQLKSRYTKKSTYKRFLTGVDYDKMRLFNVEANEQKGLYENREENQVQPQTVKSKSVDTTQWEM